MINFTKMQALGNDYVYVNCYQEPLAGVDVPALARAMSDRHFGVGSDGLIMICPAEHGVEADCRMVMHNVDGSRAEMCGNGVRCVAKYVLDRGIVAGRRMSDPASADCLGGGPAAGTDERREIRIQTDRGVLTLEAAMKGGRMLSARVDMGAPILEPAKIPVSLPGERCVRAPLLVGTERYTMTCVSMGNPHAVVFVSSLAAVDLPKLGPVVERHPLFPHRVNLQFACAPSRREATVRTWERGAGLTMACGTGACAVLVAGVLEDRLDRVATIHLPGGDLEVEWAEGGQGPGAVGTIYVTGPATEVFSGQWPT
jgi:diaminopimelate epimerase